jgi:hypothetical protein
LILDKLVQFLYNRIATKNQTKTNNPTRRNQMAKKKNTLKTYPYLETWNTRYGQSERIVLRKGGKFVDNTSLTALKQGVRVSSR